MKKRIFTFIIIFFTFNPFFPNVPFWSPWKFSLTVKCLFFEILLFSYSFQLLVVNFLDKFCTYCCKRIFKFISNIGFTNNFSFIYHNFLRKRAFVDFSFTSFSFTNMFLAFSFMFHNCSAEYLLQEIFKNWKNRIVLIFK